MGWELVDLAAKCGRCGLAILGARGARDVGLKIEWALHRMSIRCEAP
jgi:hypothetical protein